MRALFFLLAASALFATIGAGGARAGGAGSAALLWQKDAICEQQRRGETPRAPDLCWPQDQPAAPPPSPRRLRR